MKETLRGGKKMTAEKKELINPERFYTLTCLKKENNFIKNIKEKIILSSSQIN